MKCQARQYSDQKVCDACGLVWDMNDPDPPSCRTAAEVAKERIRAMLGQPLTVDARDAAWRQIRHYASNDVYACRIVEAPEPVRELVLLETVVNLLRERKQRNRERLDNLLMRRPSNESPT